MNDMTPLEYQHFMLDRARTAKLATVSADGRPHVAPIWFDLDGEVLVFNTGENTVKGRNIQRDGRVSLCIDDEAPPFAFVIISGQAEIVTPTADMLVYWATRIAKRYMGADQGEAYGQRNGVPGELLVRVTPGKVLAKNGIAD